MARKVRLDRKQVLCRNSSLMGFSTNQAKPNLWVSFHDSNLKGAIAGNGFVIGRIAEIEPDGLEDCRGWLAVAVLSSDATFWMYRWVSPEDVLYVHPMPKHIALPELEDVVGFENASFGG